MRFRFLIDESGVQAAARRYLVRDMQQARLSLLFRLYYHVRRLVPMRLRRELQKHRPVACGPDWFIPSGFVKTIRDTIGRGNQLTVIHPWPDNACFGFVLTHDVESADGLRNVERLAAIEEDLGFRSSWNFVPYKYRIDMGLIADLRQRGFEIGIHGYNHDGRLYSSLREFRRRVPAIQDALRKFSAVGFRSPMVHRNLDWLQALDIEYDASCFDIDPYQPMPGGVGAVWPFVFGRFVELPYTMPQDHTVFNVREENSSDTWTRKIDFISRISGLALMLTHPDYLRTDQLRGVYRGFLDHVRCQGQYWHALPRDVARWWQIRDATTTHRLPSGEWTISGPSPDRASIAAIDVDGDALQLRVVQKTQASSG
jgi:peptidoglycan/xylan/chitin deacetylase (PgdA/CDA1 family)